MEPLSNRQSEMLEFIASHIDRTGVPPSYREIGAALGIGSTNGVSDHIKALERKGYVERVGGRGASRSLRLTAEVQANVDQESTISVPVLGRVAAGIPLLAEENYDHSVRVDAGMLPSSGRVFALIVTGDSMNEDGIMDGDTLFVHETATVRQGEIAVVLVDDEATVKRWFREGNRIRLQPSNREMAPIYVDGTQDVRVIGKAVGCFRRL